VHEGVGMRKTGRLVGVKEDTVIRYARRAGAHAKQLHDEFVAFSPLGPGRCSSTRSGRSWPRRRTAATPPPTRPTPRRVIAGTTSPWARSTGWCWRPSPASVRPSTPASWWRT
jgi:hypothetical protein